jgi:hypothetical protein
MTPTLIHDDVSAPRSFAMLPSYRPVTMDTQNTEPPVSERPTSRCTSPLVRQHSLEQISQTSQQRSSEEDVILSSGVHSVGDESDQVIITTTPISRVIWKRKIPGNEVDDDSRGWNDRQCNLVEFITMVY